jgi:two-component system, response regulator RegA
MFAGGVVALDRDRATRRVKRSVWTDPFPACGRNGSMQQYSAPRSTVLIADNDPVFRRTLERAMERRGHTVASVGTIAEAHHAIVKYRPSHAIVDIRFADGTVIDLLTLLRGQRPAVRAIVLTGSGSVASAVACAKAGAADYLAKPSDADSIEAAMLGGPLVSAERIYARPDEIEFRYLLTIFEQHHRNMSETARAIGMHRRTLQRILRRRGIAPTTKAALDHPNERQRTRRLYRLWTHLLNGDAEPSLRQLRDETSYATAAQCNAGERNAAELALVTSARPATRTP